MIPDLCKRFLSVCNFNPLHFYIDNGKISIKSAPTNQDLQYLNFGGLSQVSIPSTTVGYQPTGRQTPLFNLNKQRNVHINFTTDTERDNDNQRFAVRYRLYDIQTGNVIHTFGRGSVPKYFDNFAGDEYQSFDAIVTLPAGNHEIRLEAEVYAIFFGAGPTNLQFQDYDGYIQYID